MACGGSDPQSPEGSTVQDRQSVQQIADRECKSEGIESITAVDHAAYGKTEGFLLVCKNDLTNIIAVGR